MLLVQYCSVINEHLIKLEYVFVKCQKCSISFFFVTAMELIIKNKGLSFALFTSTAFFEYKEDGGRFPNPPSYSVATTLPSYDEAERNKAEAAIPLVTGRISVTLLFSDTRF